MWILFIMINYLILNWSKTTGIYDCDKDFCLGFQLDNKSAKTWLSYGKANFENFRQIIGV
jgi:hypothetical protein